MRYFVWFSYDGTAYHGWQIQPNGNSVQEELQRALSTLLREEISVTGAGRTDAGVHARQMVAHFDFSEAIDLEQLAYKLNRILPCDIAVEELHYELDFDKMNEAGRILMTYDDFGAFCKSHSDVKRTLCRVTKAEWVQTSETSWYFEITANRFLRNMVRAVVGTLIDVGRGRLTLDDFRKVIEGKRRTEAGESMPANALFLENIRY